MSKFTEIDLSHLIKERPLEEVIIFNNDPTLKDIEEAFNNDQIIVFNCINNNLYKVESFIESIPEEHKNNIAVYCYEMEQEEFEEQVKSGLSHIQELYKLILEKNHE